MDTELIRTFIEIASCKSFIRAATRLNVAQTTVSARIRTLEERLGRRLFVRHKGGATLTPAGEQLLRHAPRFVQMWQRMQRQVAVPSGHSAFLTIGGEVNLWQPIVLDWTELVRQKRPDIALRVHADVPHDLIGHVASGQVDVAVMYAPPHRPGVKMDLLIDEKLVLVTTDPGADPFGEFSFVSVDWGPEFTEALSTSFPGTEAPSLSTNLGPLGIQYILKCGGSGYFRWRSVEPHIAAGRLHLVADMPRFSYPIYAVSCTQSDEALLAPVLACLHEAIGKPVKPIGF
ncbi:MAG: LysR family transcriptional regulator [Paracoccaceae bacterium]